MHILWCVDKSAPMYLQEICNFQSAQMRIDCDFPADHGDLVVPSANADRFGRRGFSVSGPNQWNKLPPHTRK